jgi:hypothetical protein
VRRRNSAPRRAALRSRRAALSRARPSAAVRDRRSPGAALSAADIPKDIPLRWRLARISSSCQMRAMR